MNGIIAKYTIDKTKFKVGEAFEFYMGKNTYVSAILKEIHENTLVFISLLGEFRVTQENNNFHIHLPNNGETRTAVFRKQKPSYDEKDSFNWNI